MHVTEWGGKRPWFYQLAVSAVQGFSRDLLDEKSKLFAGAGVVVANDVCIIILIKVCVLFEKFRSTCQETPGLIMIFKRRCSRLVLLIVTLLQCGLRLHVGTLSSPLRYMKN